MHIQSRSQVIVLWTGNNWNDNHEAETTDKGLGVFFADIELSNKLGKSKALTFYWSDTGKWENRNYKIEIE